MTASDDNLINSKICSHTPAMFTSKNLTAYEITQCIYVDDGAFPFGSREDLTRGMELIFHHFDRFGLQMQFVKGHHRPKPNASSSPLPSSFNMRNAMKQLPR